MHQWVSAGAKHLWAPLMLLQAMLVAGALCSAAVSCTSMQSKDLELDWVDRVGRGSVTHFWSSPLRGMAALSVSSSSLQHQAMKYTPAATYARNTLRLPVLVSCSGRYVSCERGVMRIDEGQVCAPKQHGSQELVYRCVSHVCALHSSWCLQLKSRLEP